jgi:hypothetical protein
MPVVGTTRPRHRQRSFGADEEFALGHRLPHPSLGGFTSRIVSFWKSRSASSTSVICTRQTSGIVRQRINCRRPSVTAMLRRAMNKAASKLTVPSCCSAVGLEGIDMPRRGLGSGMFGRLGNCICGSASPGIVGVVSRDPDPAIPELMPPPTSASSDGRRCSPSLGRFGGGSRRMGSSGIRCSDEPMRLSSLSRTASSEARDRCGALFRAGAFLLRGAARCAFAGARTPVDFDRRPSFALTGTARTDLRATSNLRCTWHTCNSPRLRKFACERRSSGYPPASPDRTRRASEASCALIGSEQNRGTLCASARS